MAKAKKVTPMPRKESAQAEPVQAEPVQEPCPPVIPESTIMGQPLQVEFGRDCLWELYVARVAKAETVHTMVRSGEKIFADALAEAKVALKVWKESEENHE